MASESHCWKCGVGLEQGECPNACGDKPNMSGYVDCACRDCFDIAIAGESGIALCHDCKKAGCLIPSDGDGTNPEDLEPGIRSLAMFQCKRPDAYGVDDSTED